MGFRDNYLKKQNIADRTFQYGGDFNILIQSRQSCKENRYFFVVYNYNDKIFSLSFIKCYFHQILRLTFCLIQFVILIVKKINFVFKSMFFFNLPALNINYYFNLHCIFNFYFYQICVLFIQQICIFYFYFLPDVYI